MAISEKNYDDLKQKFGNTSSWCIWSPVGDTPKSNTGDMSWATDDHIDNLLKMVDTDYVFVGLNWSSAHGDQTKNGTIAWKSFHSDYGYQNDFKLRYALAGTKYWGSYITDIIKNCPTTDAKNLRSILKKHPELKEENIKLFREELKLLLHESTKGKKILIALGEAAYEMLTSFQIKDDELKRYQIVKIKHYASLLGKEKYREEVLEILNSIKIE